MRNKQSSHNGAPFTAITECYYLKLALGATQYTLECPSCHHGLHRPSCNMHTHQTQQEQQHKAQETGMQRSVALHVNSRKNLTLHASASIQGSGSKGVLVISSPACLGTKHCGKLSSLPCTKTPRTQPSTHAKSNAILPSMCDKQASDDAARFTDITRSHLRSLQWQLRIILW